MKFFQKKRLLFLLLLLNLTGINSFAVDYYWVGGAGNWSDISHWATTSGGTVYYTLPPTATDNVYFDGGSGFTSASKTVTVNQSSFCNDIIWSGSAISPIFSVSYTLQVNGSLEFQPGMTVNGSKNSATITFTSSLPNQTVTTGNLALIDIPFTFDGTGGWVLQDSLRLPDGYNLRFNRGDLDFNGQYVKIGYFAGASTSGTLNIANSTINVTGSWNYNTAGSAPITAANSVNSHIYVSSVSMTTKANDVYYNVTLANTNNNGGISGGGIFNKVIFLNGGTVGALRTDTLILKSAKVYNITNNNVNINKYFEANLPACSGLMELLGTGTITMGTDAVTDVANTRIQNVTIQGPDAPYEASSSIDLGGNTGWDFTAPTASTYYWVGGGGNWNDVLHWADSSGGTPGSGCVPIQLDDVIFDANSGFGTTTATKTVTLDGNAYCNNMTWNGAPNNPIFTVRYPLQINASLELQSGMTTTGNSSNIISFTTTLPNQTITSNGVVINSPITFNGIGGWDLQDSLLVPSQQVTFTNGSLNFNGQYVSMKNFSSISGVNTRSLNIANSIIDVDSPGWRYTGGVALTAPNSINSEIRINATASTVNAKTNDVYYNVTFFASYWVQSGITNGIYNKVSVLDGSGLNITTITTDSLILKAIAKYQFGAGTNIIRKYLEASPPSCSGLIELLSGTTGSARTISIYTGAVVDVNNCRIQDIRLTGDTPYTTVGSVDLGNNSGWTFIAPDPHTYYWVGGSGNWNDGDHWADTSGGTPGSGCVPTQYDNVIFDDASGFLSTAKTVTIDGNAYCDSMTWAGSAVLPIFNVNRSFEINGSLKLQPGMTVTLNTSIVFTSSRPNETITTENVVLGGSGYSFTFNGTGGWQLQDSLKLNSNSISLIKGNLDFNEQYVKLNGFGSSNSNSRSLDILNSTIEAYNTWNYTGTGSTPLTPALSANSTIRFTSSSFTLTSDADDVYYNVESFVGSLTSTGTITRGIYNKIKANKVALVLNAITTDTLIYAPGGSTNTFTSGATSVINKLWITNGTPCLPTTIQASTSGSRANISMPATAANMPPDTVLFDFVRIRDLNAVTGTNRAILEKGSQSIDDSGYGLSGNNSNWTIIPYAGASGFEGLGSDIALGCQDYPSTITLESAYYAGTDGSYEWRKDSRTSPVIGIQPQLLVTTPGTYYLTINYDLAKTCSLSASKVVYDNADTLIWTGNGGNADWNNSANWQKTDGTSDVTTVPRNCTDVFIPSGMAQYPSLDMTNTNRTSYPDVACQNIHFDSGAEVAYTDSLHYNEAYVDLTLQRDKWYMLSAPLQNMYSGDYWMAPWNTTVADGSAYNRNNPRVYMQQYQLKNPETGYYPGAANWSNAFNTLDVTLGIGQGYVVGIDEPGTDQTFHFPRPETQFQYFNKTTGLPSSTWTSTLDRTNSFRMHVEPGFNGVVPVSWDSVSRSTIILGNPFMAHLSFAALQAGNPGVFGTTYYVWTGNSFDAFTVEGDQTTKTDWTSLTVDQIAPMQSVIVEKQNPASLITSVNINSGMAVTAPGIDLRSDAKPYSVNLAVYRDDVRQSAATLLLTEGKNVTTLFSGTVKTPAVVYFGTKNAPYSIRNTNMKEEVEVGIQSTATGTLTFKLQGTESLPAGTSIYLEDKLLGISQNMTEVPVYTFNNQTGNIEGRFYLRTPFISTGTDQLSKQEITIYADQGTVHVSTGDPIQTIEVFNLQGQMVYKQNNLNVKNYSFQPNTSQQVLIVKVITTGISKSEKVRL